MFSAIPSSSSLSRNWPIWPSCSTIPSGYTPSPVLPWDSAFRWVKTCIRVEFHQRKNGLSSWCARSMKSIAPARNSSSTVSIRFLVSGPVSSMRCLPDPPVLGMVGRIVFVGRPGVEDTAGPESFAEVGEALRGRDSPDARALLRR